MENVLRVPRPRFNNTPLAEAYQACADTLSRFGEPAPAPISWLNVDLMEDRIAQLRKAQEPPPPSAALLALSNEALHLVVEINSYALKIKAAQPWLSRARNDWRHQRLRDIPADSFVVPLPLESQHYTAAALGSVEAAQAVIKTVHAQLTWLRTIWAGIENAQRFEAKAVAEQVMELMRAVCTHELPNLKSRIVTLEAQNAALRAQLVPSKKAVRKVA
jgi:hypothetical protein